MYFYAARQPILDRNKALYAYELLFRNGNANSFPLIDGNEATSRMIEGSQLSFTLDELLGNKPGFINFTMDTLLRQYPLMLPSHKVIIEILEDTLPQASLLDECKKLKKQGYTLALDDHTYTSDWEPFYPYIDIIKVDFRVSSVLNLQNIVDTAAKHRHIRLLAEKIETNSEFEQALQLGFSYFQGYFFARPEMLQTRVLPPASLAILRLLAEVSKPEPELATIIRIFEHDIPLSYKLLRYSNSVIFRRQSEIATIKQAIIVLGLQELKRFLSLLFMANISTDKPAELLRMSVIRAGFTEALSRIHQQSCPEKAFLAGMLSLIDAILDQSIESVMQQLPLSQDIKTALIDKTGPFAQYIDVIHHYETAAWAELDINAQKLGISVDDIHQAYHQAVLWADTHTVLLE